MNKITKHTSILKRRLNQRSELNKMKAIDNELLQVITKSFDLTKSGDNQKEDLEAFQLCEAYREKLLADTTQITYEVFNMDHVDTVQNICRKAASPAKWCRFLYHMTRSLNQPRILEIGTNVGISGTYLLHSSKANNGRLTTMEGLPQLCNLSAEQFATIVPESNFAVIQGLYENTFPEVLKRDETYNLLFIDGNHKKEPTLEYFEALMDKIDQAAIFVFDDINWSQGMSEAWEQIKRNEHVNFSIDLYKLGIVIIDRNETRKNVEFGLHLEY